MIVFWILCLSLVLDKLRANNATGELSQSWLAPVLDRISESTALFFGAGLPAMEPTIQTVFAPLMWSVFQISGVLIGVYHFGIFIAFIYTIILRR